MNPQHPAVRPFLLTGLALSAVLSIPAAAQESRGPYPWRPFATVARPDVPRVQNDSWVRNPIDVFLAAEHEARGLVPRPEASKPVLLRRVYLDLIGLPPTRAELHAFLADESPDAYERVVERLLASPHHGERWGRHWMDVWRYSDWAGYGSQVRDSQPHVWRWRDWIVEALNADKGYDRMVLEMLAGDELAPDDPDTLRATGYLVRNFKLLSREKWMQDVVDHTAQAFLGVTLGCARCHDHMYDPIPQQEYYQVRAVFEPHQVRIDRLPGQPDTAKDGLARAYDADPQAKTFLFVRGDDRTPDKTPLAAGVPAALGGKFPPAEPISLPSFAYNPDKRAFVVEETLAAAEAAVRTAGKSLEAARASAAKSLVQAGLGEPLMTVARWPGVQKALDALALAEADGSLAEARHAALTAAVRAERLEDAGKKDSPEWKQAATEAAAAQRSQAVWEARRNGLAARQALRAAPEKTRADAAKKAEAAEKALAKAEADARQPPTTAYTPRPTKAYPKESTGRRLAFARWITGEGNPLTARVAMNHVWLRHFGQALVPTVADFGRNGKPPSHPALLDWLAAEFMDRGWSMKAMHRLIVTSSAYRTASTPDDVNLARDRDNTYLWRMNSRRLEAEAVRDSVFRVAGRLDATLGGPDIDFKEGLTRPRRSLYFRHAAEKQMEFLRLFDAADVVESYQRKESVMPQQALALVNSELTLKHARLLARDLAAEAGSEAEAFVTAAFEQVLARPPTAEELAECVAFLRQQARRYTEAKALPAVAADGSRPAADPALRARENLVHVLMNHHDFVTVR